MVFIPNFSTLKGEPQDQATNDKQYAETQQQRALERRLREEKRDLEVMKAQGASAEQIKAQREKVRSASADIDEFCDKTGLPRRRNREYTPINATFPNDVPPINPIDPNTPPINIHLGDDNIPPVVQAQREEFIPAKTRAEAESYAQKHFADNVNYKGMNLDNCNKVNETLLELTDKYPINRYDLISQQAQGSIARANYKTLEINGKKLGQTLMNDDINFKLDQAFTRQNLKSIQERWEGKPKIPFAIQNSIEKLENKLKYTRWSISSTYDDHIKATIAHEYGHTLSDQYFGMINKERANPNDAKSWALRNMRQEWENTLVKARQTGDIYKISEYGNRNSSEFFAECFAARFMGEQLPDYIEKLMVEVLTNGIM